MLPFNRIRPNAQEASLLKSYATHSGQNYSECVAFQFPWRCGSAWNLPLVPPSGALISGTEGFSIVSIKLTQIMTLIYSEWLAILLFIVVSIGLSGVLFGLSYAFIHQNPDLEKTSAYECGFNPFEDARNKFDVRFYVVAILFIIFDLEVIFLCPWSLVLRRIDSLGFWSMMLFLVLVTIGFVFEWRKGALDWS